MKVAQQYKSAVNLKQETKSLEENEMELIRKL